MTDICRRRAGYFKGGLARTEPLGAGAGELIETKAIVPSTLVRCADTRPLQRSIATSARLAVIAFGQQPGPPASSRQVQQLLGLLKDAGHADFRDARGPMGFTQRQATGKFTRDEAAAFIDRLQSKELDGSAVAPVPTARLSAQEQLLRHMPAEQLAVELRRRGWTVTEP